MGHGADLMFNRMREAAIAAGTVDEAYANAIRKCLALSPNADATFGEKIVGSGVTNVDSNLMDVDEDLFAFGGASGTLEEWYVDNCSTWVGLLGDIEANVDLYNHSVAECRTEYPTEFEAGSIVLPVLPDVTFYNGSDMIGDTTRFLNKLVGQEALLVGQEVAECADFASMRSTLGTDLATLQVLMTEYLDVAQRSRDINEGKDLGVFEGALVGIANALQGWLDNDATDAKRKADAERLRLLAEEGTDAPRQDTFKMHVFKEQCFLLAKLFDIVDHKKVADAADGSFKELPYVGDAGNSSLIVEGDPFGFINTLVQDPSQSALFDMTTEEISSLQPMIRLFKVGEVKAEGALRMQGAVTQEGEQEFMFDASTTAADVESVFKDKGRRGHGVGIKKFTFKYDGHTPFAAKKSISAKLSIFASSFGELLIDRGGYSYADLALKTSGPILKSDVCDESTTTAALQTVNDNLYKLNFRLKAVVGWAYPSGDTSLFATKSETQKSTILKALKESYVTLNLTPVTHEFNIDEMGRVTFDIHYLAYIEDFFDQPQFNIFYDPPAAMGQMFRKLSRAALSEDCKPEQISELKRIDAESGIITRDKNNSMRSLIARMEDLNRIWYIPLSYDEIKAFQTGGPFFEFRAGMTNEIKSADSAAGTLSKELKDAYIEQFVTPGMTEKGAEAHREMISIALEANNPMSGDVGFFYVSDLVDTCLESIEEYLQFYAKDGPAWDVIKTDKRMAEVPECEIEKEKAAISRFYANFKRFRVVLGPLEIIDPRRGAEASKFISLGDIPVSVKYFVEWLNERLTRKEQSTYFLSRFLNDLFNNLINDFLNDDGCFTFNTKQKISLNQAVLTSYPKSKITTETGAMAGGYVHPELDEITDYILNSAGTAYGGRLSLGDVTAAGSIVSEYWPFPSAGDMPLLNISGEVNSLITNPGVQNEMNYCTFSAGRTRPAEYMSGDRTLDEQQGIFHYVVGRPRGIVKTIKLNKTNVPYLKEVRFEQEGYDGLEQLREVYDITIDTFANVKTFPGTYVFVDPRGLSPDTNLVPDDLMNLTQYGVGGYCMIIQSEHSFGPGLANTTLTTKWVAETTSVDYENAVTTRTDAGTGEANHCDKLISVRKAAAKSAKQAAGPEQRQRLSFYAPEDDVAVAPSGATRLTATERKAAGAKARKDAYDDVVF